MMSTLGRAVRAWQRLQRDDFLRRPQNVYQYTWDAARVSALVFGCYCGVKLAWELAYEAMPDAFRSAELAKASAVEMDRERANAWNDQEGRPMSEREFLVSRALRRRHQIEASLGCDRPLDLSESDAAAVAAAGLARGRFAARSAGDSARR